MLNKFYPLLVTTLFFVSAINAQQHSQPNIAAMGLYREIKQADSIVFNAFNNCDSLTYRKFFTDDLEFYHDLGGLSVGINIEMRELKEMCARGSHMRRALVNNTLEVYPIKDYGAIEIGTHQFFHTNKGESEKPSGTYKFVQIWQKKNGQWKIARVISYDHAEMHNY